MKAFDRIKGWAEKAERELSALYLAYRRRDTPLPAKIAAAAAVFYALSPIDLIPDFIPVLGYLDDLLILPLLIGLAVRLIPASILEECREEAERRDDKKDKKLRYALPVLLLWALLLWLVIKAIWFSH